jgi:hypothetical protein
MDGGWFIWAGEPCLEKGEEILCTVVDMTSITGRLSFSHFSKVGSWGFAGNGSVIEI